MQGNSKPQSDAKSDGSSGDQEEEGNSQSEVIALLKAVQDDIAGIKGDMDAIKKDQSAATNALSELKQKVDAQTEENKQSRVVTNEKIDNVESSLKTEIVLRDQQINTMSDSLRRLQGMVDDQHQLQAYIPQRRGGSMEPMQPIRYGPSSEEANSGIPDWRLILEDE